MFGVKFRTGYAQFYWHLAISEFLDFPMLQFSAISCCMVMVIDATAYSLSEKATWKHARLRKCTSFRESDGSFPVTNHTSILLSFEDIRV